ncbi:hypothetical protein SCHPADRAFT_700447 [Schizopora paradoxa]|uniref:DUF6533 domain-containing protein n=1 Tax=Schizopora paradoxa TaxID=27342 RepID=A0A0H2R9C1_9AGAM|nr:hypothetical protein SCHPADRAFT_700447 [Schizopora paradoxa]
MTTLAETTTLLEQTVTVKLYDTILCFGDEVKYIWTVRWSAGKVLYIMARYLAFVDLTLLLLYNLDPYLGPSQCKLMYETSAWFQVVGVLVAEILLIIRTYALYERNRYILAYLVCLELGLTIPSIIFIEESFSLISYTQSPAPTILPCLPMTGDTRTWFAFMCICIFDFNVTVLTVYKGFHQWKNGMSKVPLVRTIYRDGGLYFICLFVVSLANVLLLKNEADSPYYILLFGLQRVLHAVLTSRLIINVRKASENPWCNDTSISIENTKSKDVRKSTLRFSDRDQMELQQATWASQQVSVGEI